MGNHATEEVAVCRRVDAPTSEVSFAKLGRKSVLQQVKEIFANQPGRPKPIIDAPPPQPIPVGAAATTPAPPTEMAMEPSKVAEPVSIGSGVAASDENGVGAVERAAVGLAKAGLTFLQSIAAELQSRSSAGRQVQGALSTLFSRHPQTNHPILSIPLPESFTAERITQAVSRFLSALEVPDIANRVRRERQRLPYLPPHRKRLGSSSSSWKFCCRGVSDQG